MAVKFNWYNPVIGAQVETEIPEATWEEWKQEYETNKVDYIRRGCTDFETYVIMILWMEASK